MRATPTVLFALLLFYVLPALAEPAVPTGSRWIDCAGRRIHLHEAGHGATDTAIMLLSGPTDSWASDSAWHTALQPQLPSGVVTRIVDRLNHGLSGIGEDGSYQRFADDLHCLMQVLPEQQHVLVAFASSNLSVLHYLHRYGIERIKAVLLIDPDGLTPEIIHFYAEQAKPFQAAGNADYVRSGKFDQRAAAKVTADREHFLATLNGAPYNQTLFDAVLAGRSDRERLIAQMADIGRYDQDILGAAKLTWPKDVPVWAVDSDFEKLAIIQSTQADERTKYQHWREQNALWMQALPGVCYLPIDSTEHLVMVEQAKMIAELTGKLLAEASCPHSS